MRPGVTTSRCPEGGSGGPFWRVCTTPLFTAGGTQPVTDGAQATIMLPCRAKAPDFRKRSLGGGRTTTDEGYAYFSYSISPDRAFEVGLEHNSKASNDVSYKLYATGVPGSTGFMQAKGQIACGQPLILVFGIGDAGRGQFLAAVMNAQPPVQVYAHLELTVPGASSWVACRCRLSMVTAIAQNGWVQTKHGKVPGAVPVPLPDGASYGPVRWSSVKYLVDTPHNYAWKPVTA
ncbi:MAG: hypothetical protein JO242_13850, partial [Streptosporangiaceae bacterium]|nr:hypothetical protein [Streptosporangiaceae bacterium]